MTSVSVDISVDANDESWSMNGQFDVQKTVIIGRSGFPVEDIFFVINKYILLKRMNTL